MRYKSSIDNINKHSTPTKPHKALVTNPSNWIRPQGDATSHPPSRSPCPGPGAPLGLRTPETGSAGAEGSRSHYVSSARLLRSGPAPAAALPRNRVSTQPKPPETRSLPAGLASSSCSQPKSVSLEKTLPLNQPCCKNSGS